MKYPQTVQIIEVGPRDGFQNIAVWIPTAVKLKVIEGLVRAGIKAIEATSFVHPKALPQMKDAEEVVRGVLEKYPQTDFTALVPNLHGARAAWNCGIKKVTYVISVSEAHNKANVNRTSQESFADLKLIIAELPELKITLTLATVFGCPFQGNIPIGDIRKMIRTARELGLRDICLSDTIGSANPLQMRQVLEELQSEFSLGGFGLHLHDTRGMGLANSLVAIEHGITRFETSLGGLGGCPFAPGAAGNVATEDFANMLESMGIVTGINLAILLNTVDLVRTNIKSDLAGHMVRVGAL